MIDWPNRQSIRLRGYDYTQNGVYFCTICTQNRENLFGEIENGEMYLNTFGRVVDYWLKQIPRKYPGVILDKYQIMPNHIHVIIKIVVGARSPRPDIKIINPMLGQIMAFFKYQSAKQIRMINGAETAPTMGNSSGGETAGGETPPLRKRVYIKKIWQRNYYEHIIRNEPEYEKICFYITNNPKTWGRDRNNLI